MSCKFFRSPGAIAALISTLPVCLASASAQEDEDSIIVTGSPISRSVDETLVGVSVLGGEELADRLAGTIGETLKSEPGITSTFFGAGASRPIIRGQGGDRIRILDNGIGSIDAAAASPDHAVAAEPALAERVEVIRGSGILRYGSSASAGVVNIIDGRIPRTIPEDGIDGAVRVSATSVDDGYEAAGGADFLLGTAGQSSVILHFEGTRRDGGDYDIPGFAESAKLRALEEAEDGEEAGAEEVRDTLENSYTESDSVAAGLSFVGRRGFIGVAVKKFNATYGVPGGHGHDEGEEEAGGVSIDLDQTRYDLNGEIDLDWAGFERFNIFAGYADYEHQEIEGSGEIGTVFTNEGYEIRAELVQRTRGIWQGAVGIQYRDREFSASGAEAFVPPTTSDQLGIFTFQETEFGDWHFEGAARYETTSHQDSTNGISRDFDGFSVSAGADYHVNEQWRVGGTVLANERAPTTEELFSNGPHLATNQFEVGDASLGIEKAKGVEVSVRYGADNASLTVNAFRTSYDDYIFLGATGNEQDGLPEFMFQTADTVFKGYEIVGDADLGSGGGFNWRADAIVELVEAEKDVTGNDNLPFIPPLGLLVGIEAENDHLKLRGEIDHATEQTNVAPLELTTDNYTLVNLFTTFTPFPDEPSLKIRLAATNVTDEEARQHSSPLKELVPLPGRNFRISIEKRF